jgi:hypothetical protein
MVNQLIPSRNRIWHWLLKVDSLRLNLMNSQDAVPEGAS